MRLMPHVLADRAIKSGFVREKVRGRIHVEKLACEKRNEALVLPGDAGNRRGRLAPVLLQHEKGLSDNIERTAVP